MATRQSILDGPYVLYAPAPRVVYVDAAGQIVKAARQQGQAFLCRSSGPSQAEFSFQLQNTFMPPPAAYDASPKILALSDIEGNFEAFAGLLLGNGIIDKSYTWHFGTGDLVLVGDFMDRDEDVLPCLWLIYKLEQEARTAGGRVHFLLGNHELMNLQADVRYVPRKYLQVAHQLSGIEDTRQAYKFLFSQDTELGRWLRTKNVIEQIGPFLFVHAGLSPAILPLQLSIEEINHICRRHLDSDRSHPAMQASKQARLLLGSEGPLWFRGLVSYPGMDTPKVTAPELDKLLDYYQAEKMVIGHTIVEQISTDYSGKLIRLDVEQPQKRGTGKAQALLLLDQVAYRVNDQGIRTKL